MKLRKIVVCGFKSFADKTEFDFGDGVTVIVGPNGCGKSNVVDAVKWVLGEQSAKSLRGNQMLDVIFNGTSNRKSMGYAEVTLVFDNSSRLLNLDMNEVSVTRKLFRSGESQYMLGGKTCRLKDIRELFMDTGVGADTYSIIEQGKVTTMLQANADERRAIFEEAAGISRYKARKKEALRKLDRTEQNLLRLQDIIAEVEKRLRAIKVQAGKARNYQTYSQRLNELRLNQYLSEYNRYQIDSREKRHDMDVVQDELVGLTTENERNQAQLSILTDQVDQVDRELRQIENQLLQYTSQIGSQQDRIDFGHTRCEELQGMITRNRQQIMEMRQQCQGLEEQIRHCEQELAASDGEVEQRRSELETAQQERQQTILELNEYRAQLDDEKTGLFDIVRRTARLHNEIESLTMRQDNLSGQKDRLNDRSDQIRKEVGELLTRRAQYEEKLGAIQKLQGESQQQLETKREQLARISEERLQCSENLSTAREYRSGLLSRQQVLSDMESRFEGIDQGVRQILQERKKAPDDYYYIRGIVAELIRADVQHAALVEAALDNVSQYLVVSDSQALLNHAAHYEELKGRVRMICLDRINTADEPFDCSGLSQVRARLSDLVSASHDCEKLAGQLLGKTLLVDNLAAAFEVANLVPAGYRFVTMDGQVLEAAGVLHVGPNTGQAGLISRKSELRELKSGIKEVEERIEELVRQSEQFASQAQHLERNLQELRTAIYEARAEEVETRGRIEQIDQNTDRLKQEEPLIASEVSMIEQQITEAMENQATSKRDLDELQEINRQRQEHIDFLEEQIAVLENQDQDAINSITNLKVTLGQIQQKTLGTREQLATIRSQMQQYRHNISSMQHDLDTAGENLVQTQRTILQAESRIAELFMERQQGQEQLRTVRQRQEELTGEKAALEEACRAQNRLREEKQNRLHELQMKYNEANLRTESLLQRANEELAINLEEKIQEHEIQEMDWEAVAAEIKDLKDKIHRLGNINLDAIAEQEELEERFEYLTGQFNDLTESRKQLEQLIEKINVESTEIFRKNFEAIRENFAELFRKLFGGGKADIILQDPENILECGIDIIARPPGKQLQSITLMSGGEKTMAAVALLMAIFRSKPSPFCLLDEVDAALDEANIERFNMVVKEFLNESQFVIITHARRTMSIADVIYGITMQERGVSKKVSVKFSGEEDNPEPEGAVA